MLQESKKQSGMCAAHAEVIMITHIKLLHDNLLEKNPHFSLNSLTSLFTLPYQFFPTHQEEQLSTVFEYLGVTIQLF